MRRWWGTFLVRLGLTLWPRAMEESLETTFRPTLNHLQDELLSRNRELAVLQVAYNELAAVRDRRAAPTAAARFPTAGRMSMSVLPINSVNSDDHWTYNVSWAPLIVRRHAGPTIFTGKEPEDL